MNWVIHYEICSVVLLCIVLLLFLSRKSTPALRNKIFCAFVVISLATSFVNLLAVHADAPENVFPRAFFIGINVFYYLMQNLIPFLVTAYVLALTDRKVYPGTPFSLALFLPFAMSELAAVLTIFYPLIFSVDENMRYQRENGVFIIYFCAFYYFAFILITVRNGKDSLSSFQRAAIYLFVGLAVLVVPLQYLLAGYLLNGFASAVTAIMMLFALQNPVGEVDELTGLYNRKAFVAFLSESIRKKKPLVIVAAALDNFRSVNQNYGMPMGDLILKEVANFFSNNLSQATAFRLGGDHFAILIHAEREAGEQEIRRIRRWFASVWTVKDVDVLLSTSVCLIEYPKDAEKLEEIIYGLDYALLEAKRRGVNTTVYADEKLLRYGSRRDIVREAIRSAVARDEGIEVFFQPVFSVEASRCISAEALVRIEDGKLGTIYPEEFIPIAEQDGMILSLGTRIFEKVCEFINKNDLPALGISLMEVNFSVAQCLQTNFTKSLAGIMHRYRISPQYINLEITETDIANPTEEMLRSMHELLALGVSFSMDDYGTGYSNINHMIRFPFRYIKLDKGIVWSSSESAKAEVVIRRTVEMLKSLDFQIIAEGIETEAQAQKMSGYGCDYLQGYYYSKPLSGEEFLKYCILEK